MARKTGKMSWGRRLWIGAVGFLCLLLLAAVTTGLALLGSWSSISRRGEPEAKATERSVSLPAVPDGAIGNAGGALGAAATLLTIDMESGVFEVRPGPPGSDIRVEGEYAKNYYALTEERRPVGETGSEVIIRFRPTASVLTRILAGLQQFDRNHPNQLTVYIPRDHPIALTLRLAEGQSESELGGLMLTELEVDISKGSHQVDFDEPLTGKLDLVRLSARMGDMRVSELGNARFRELEANSAMGACRIDLGGVWEKGTTRIARLSHKMGELIVLIPDDVRLTESSSTGAIMGGSSHIGRRGPPDDPDAPALQLNARATMGGLSIRHR